MVDFSDPKKRERLLMLLAGITLCIIVMMVVPAQYNEMNRLKSEREKLTKDIDEREHNARNRDEIQRRFSAMQSQALTSLNPAMENESVSGYQNWLRDLMTAIGFQDVKDGGSPSASAARGGYKRHTFSVVGDGRLEHMAEFLCRFYRTEYLHQILNVTPQAVANQPGIFRVTFRVEALSLPLVDVVNVPAVAEIPAMTEADRRMLAMIRDRAILSEYTPPRPVAEVSPPEPFDDVAFCFLVGVVESDGERQCWIEYRTTGRKYRLAEEGSFVLGGYRCTIKTIDIEKQRILVSVLVDGEEHLGYVRVGRHFDDIEGVE